MTQRCTECNSLPLEGHMSTCSKKVVKLPKLVLDVPNTTTTGEVRHTDPVTGAQKGRKPEMHSLLPVPALDEVARVYGKGAEKYAVDNWRRGYPWSWSYDALHRHLNAFWDGQDLDPDDGLTHLGHAAFHVFSLLTFMLDGTGTDDRFKRPTE